jgi:hypothetical protein
LANETIGEQNLLGQNPTILQAYLVTQTTVCAGQNLGGQNRPILTGKTHGQNSKAK